MKRFLSWMLGRRLQNVLIASFALIAVLAGGLNTLVISREINGYLVNAQAERMTRDMDLANGLYQQKLNDVLSISQFVALDTQTIDQMSAAFNGDWQGVRAIGQVTNRMITAPTLDGTRMILVLDTQGNVLTGSVRPESGQIVLPNAAGNWNQIPLVAAAIASGQPLSGTEVISADYLAQVGLDKLAMIHPATAPTTQNLYDPREGTAALALVGLYPLKDAIGGLVGEVLTAYLFNNDFTLVDYAKNFAKIETMTIFLGDMRVSTSILDQSNIRAVGTLVSRDVFQEVIGQGQDYVGRSFAVNDWYIGTYEPLRDLGGNIVGMLYVGVRESIFASLIHTFNAQAITIGIICIFIAGVIAIPISRWITHPIDRLVEANRRLAKGDMDVRVESDGNGEIALLSRSFNDMMETLQNTEKELLHQAKLASMGQLAAGVAHELNNPLGTILLFADILQKEAAEDDPRKNDLKMIIDEGYRCKNIVANLLNFARQQEVLAQETDIHALLEDVIRKVSSRPKYEKVKIESSYSPDLPVIQADPSQLQQVFFNLFNNSVDAMPDGGKISILSRPLDERSVEIRVSDNGSGIPAEALDKLYTPFFTTKPAGKGTGLGLSIVYGIIKLHRGQINIQSKIGTGTTVIITLPVRLPDTHATQTIS